MAYVILSNVRLAPVFFKWEVGFLKNDWGILEVKKLHLVIWRLNIAANRVIYSDLSD